jgi:hypothetical protein
VKSTLLTGLLLWSAGCGATTGSNAPDAAHDASKDRAVADGAAVDGADSTAVDAADPADTPTGPAPEACSVDVTDPSVPGGRLHVEADSCRLKVGEGQVFRYRVELAAPISYVAPDSGGACGRCGGYTADPATLIDVSVGSGSARYCLCDVGCCGPTVATPVTIPAGSLSATFDWPGRQWSGPSDTSSPLGPPFPVGGTFAEISFRVPGVGRIDAQLPLIIE